MMYKNYNFKIRSISKIDILNSVYGIMVVKNAFQKFNYPLPK